MTSSVSGQDEPNRALRLATRAGKVDLGTGLTNNASVEPRALLFD